MSLLEPLECSLMIHSTHCGVTEVKKRLLSGVKTWPLTAAVTPLHTTSRTQGFSWAGRLALQNVSISCLTAPIASTEGGGVIAPPITRR